MHIVNQGPALLALRCSHPLQRGNAWFSSPLLPACFIHFSYLPGTDIWYSIGFHITNSMSQGCCFEKTHFAFPHGELMHTVHHIIQRVRGLGSQTPLIQILALPLPSCVSMGKLFNNSCLSFLIYKIGLVILLLWAFVEFIKNALARKWPTFFYICVHYHYVISLDLPIVPWNTNVIHEIKSIWEALEWHVYTLFYLKNMLFFG